MVKNVQKGGEKQQLSKFSPLQRLHPLQESFSLQNYSLTSVSYRALPQCSKKRACPKFPALSMHLYYIAQQTFQLPNHAGLGGAAFWRLQKQEGSLAGEHCFPVSSTGAAG